LQGGDWEVDSSRPVQAKSYKDLISTNKPSIVVPNCNPNYEGGLGWKTDQNKKFKTLSKK
jgi:hypothetical protein